MAIDLSLGKVIPKNSAGENALMWAVAHDLIDYAKVFIHYFDINEVNFHGHSALYIACLNDSAKCIELLVKNKAKNNPTKRNNLQAFVAACIGGSVTGVSLLIEKAKLFDKRRVHYPFTYSCMEQNLYNEIPNKNFMKLINNYNNQKAIEFITKWFDSRSEGFDNYKSIDLVESKYI